MTAPLVALTFWLPPAELLVARRAAAAPRPSAPLLDDDAAAAAALAAAVAPIDDGSSDGEKPAGGAPPPTVWGQLWWLLRDAPFMLVVLGYGAYTFTTQGISAFGPLFLVQSLKIVPVAVIFGRMLAAEIPAVRAVGRFGRGAVTRLVTAETVADAHALRFPRRAIGTPAGKTPVI